MWCGGRRCAQDDVRGRGVRGGLTWVGWRPSGAMLCEAECGTMKQDRRHRGVVEASAARRQLSYSIPHTHPPTHTHKHTHQHSYTHGDRHTEGASGAGAWVGRVGAWGQGGGARGEGRYRACGVAADDAGSPGSAGGRRERCQHTEGRGGGAGRRSAYRSSRPR